MAASEDIQLRDAPGGLANERVKMTVLKRYTTKHKLIAGKHLIYINSMMHVQHVERTPQRRHGQTGAGAMEITRCIGIFKAKNMEPFYPLFSSLANAYLSTLVTYS